MTTVRIGDVSYELRPWPTPDPSKCSPEDRIGILTRGSIACRDDLGDPDCKYTTSFHPSPPSWTEQAWHRLESGAWTMPSKIGPTLKEFSTRSWKRKWEEDGEGWESWIPWADPRGWFWLTEPAPLAWVEGTDTTGHPTWTCVAPEGGPIVITEYVIGHTTYHAEWEVEWAHPTQGEPAPFLDFEEAKRWAAVRVRDILTRRTL